MKLTNEIKTRMLNFKPKFEVLKKSIELSDIGISLEIPENFEIDESGIFEKFKSEYEFLENSEFKKKDKNNFENLIFPPIFILKRKNNSRPLIACYLFDSEALKAGSVMHIRSINKFELMYAGYLVKKTNLVSMNAKRILKNDLTAALSTVYGFDYKKKNEDKVTPSNLRILTYEIRKFVLTFYIVYDEKNNFEQTDIDNFIEGIKN